MNLSKLKYKFFKFYPQKLPCDTEGKRVLSDIDFSDIDLTHLTNCDFENVTIRNCNFKNSGLKIDFNKMSNPSQTLSNVILDEGIILSPNTIVDLNTIELNKNREFTSYQIITAVLKSLKGTYGEIAILRECYRNDEKMYLLAFNKTYNEYNENIKIIIEELLKKLSELRKENLLTLLKKIQSSMDNILDFAIFLISAFGEDDKIYIKDLHFTKEDIEILKDWNIRFFNNGTIIFDNCTFDISYSKAQSVFARKKIISSLLNNSRWGETIYKDCSFTDNSYSNNGIRSIKGIDFSCNTSVYIKLGTACNGTCFFCKNKTENPTDTNVEKITRTLCSSDLGLHLNQIFLGGGEPTLYLKQIKKILLEYARLIKKLESPKKDIFMFTNGSGNWKEAQEILDTIRQESNFLLNYYFILSRQAIDDEQNHKIMGINYSLDNSELKKLITINKLLFSLTCNESNMRDNFLKEYLEFGLDLGVRNFIIQNLEDKTESPNINSIERQFQELEEKLIVSGYSRVQIVSSSYYDLSLLKKDGTSVALKRYFNPMKLQSNYRICPKHSFDLGIDSDGTLYNDFQMQKILRK